MQDRGFLGEAAENEYAHYMATGCIREVNATPFINPTLFMRPDVYTLQSNSIPLECFPLHAAKYDAVRPRYTIALDSLTEWHDVLTNIGCSAVKWCFSTSDCIMLTARLSRRFDVVATSNVADYFGLDPLLQAIRPVVKPRGVALVQTLNSA